jgi:hypothetical protein
LCDLKPHGKFRNPTITPSGRKVTAAERKRKTPFQNLQIPTICPYWVLSMAVTRKEEEKEN